MSLVFTYRFNKQQPVNWKGPASNVVIPNNTRPGINGSSDTAQNYIGPDRKARPIKHWRKQLNSDNPVKSGYGKASISDLIDKPGSSVHLVRDPSNNCNSCDMSNNSLFVKEYIIPTDNSFKAPTNEDKFYDFSNNKTVCIACNPENNIIKPATTIVNKNYYSNSSSYFHNRGMTYSQKISSSKRNGITYLAADGKTPLWPTDSSKGPQVFNSLECSNTCTDSSGNPPKTIYKPNNRPFAQEGAVSSSTRLTKLKYETITKNGASFKSAYGLQAANAGKYTGSPNAIYFLKNKNYNCNPALYRKKGNKTLVCTDLILL